METKINYVSTLCIFLFFINSCKSTTENDVNNKLPPKDLQKELVLADSLISKMYGNNNIVNRLHANNFICKTYKTKDSVFVLNGKSKMRNHQLTYILQSKTRFTEPYLYDYFAQDYVSSTLIVDQTAFLLDTMLVESIEAAQNNKFSTPLSIVNTGNNFSFRFNEKEYLIIQGVPPCNGRTCSGQYLLLIEFTNKNTMMKIIRYNEYHPFSFNNIFFGDWDNNRTLDYFYIYSSLKESYVIKPYSLSDWKFVPIVNPKHEDYYLHYSCELCSGEMSDTLVLVNKNIKL